MHKVCSYLHYESQFYQLHLSVGFANVIAASFTGNYFSEWLEAPTDVNYSFKAARTLATTSSISSALRAENGLDIPRSSTIGSAFPETRTIKFPLPGFSLLISTVAFDLTAVSILLARDLNAPHCLQASIDTMSPAVSESFFPTEPILILTSLVFLTGEPDFRLFWRPI